VLLGRYRNGGNEIARLELRQQRELEGRRGQVERRQAGHEDGEGHDRDADDGERAPRASQGQHDVDCATGAREGTGLTSRCPSK
jgi:hypothetical protein